MRGRWRVAPFECGDFNFSALSQVVGSRPCVLAETFRSFHRIGTAKSPIWMCCDSVLVAFAMLRAQFSFAADAGTMICRGVEKQFLVVRLIDTVFLQPPLFDPMRAKALLEIRCQGGT